MMKRVIGAALLALSPLLLAPVSATDFSEGSQAKNWPLKGREKAKFKAKVVDAACHFSGDCPADCGGGKRQMALIREADGKFFLAMKNLQGQFQGANFDLAPFCGQVIEVDGLMVGDDPSLNGGKLYQSQFINGEKARGFNGPWKARNPEAGKLKGAWFRNDPHINERIEKTGYLGLGQEVDQAFIEEELAE